MLARKLVVPLNISGRSKAEIVRAMETSALSGILVNDPSVSFDKPIISKASTLAHSDECRCELCFQAKLDAVLAMGTI